jgi:hypothetical protein
MRIAVVTGSQREFRLLNLANHHIHELTRITKLEDLDNKYFDTVMFGTDYRQADQRLCLDVMTYFYKRNKI